MTLSAGLQADLLLAAPPSLAANRQDRSAAPQTTKEGVTD
jgi:hypothetical protein